MLNSELLLRNALSSRNELVWSGAGPTEQLNWWQCVTCAEVRVRAFPNVPVADRAVGGVGPVGRTRTIRAGETNSCVWGGTVSGG